MIGALAVLLSLAPLASADTVSSDRVAIGLDTDGSLIDDDGDLGIVWDLDGPGPEPVGGDFLTPGRDFALWAASWRADGSARDEACGGSEAPCSVDVGWSDAVWTDAMMYRHGSAALDGLTVDLWVETPWGEDLAWVTMRFTPDKGVEVTELDVAQILDADQEYDEFGSYNTFNEAGEGWAVAGPVQGNKAIAMAAVDGEGGVCSWCLSPASVRSGSSGGSSGDSQIGVAVAAPTVPPDGVELVFALGFGTDDDAAVTLALEAAADHDHDRDGATPDDGDCDDRDPNRSPYLSEWIDAVDNDCDDAVDEDTAISDDDGDGWTEADGDCDDADPRVYPGAPPLDDVADADCDGYADPLDDTGVVDTGPTDTGPADTGASDTGDPDPTDTGPYNEEDTVPELQKGGCTGCAPGPIAPVSAWPVGLVLLALMRRRAPAALAALALAGCAADKPADTGAPPSSTEPGTETDAPITDTETADTEADPPTTAVALPAGAVLDPKLPGAALPVSAELVDGGGACTLALEARTPSGLVRTLATTEEASLEATWDGLMDDGLPADVGTVELVAVADCDGAIGQSTATAHVVRLGVVAVDFTGPEEGSEGHVPLAFHKVDLVTRDIQVVEAPEYVNDREHELQLSDLDDDVGLPRVAPEPWADPNVPPWGAGEAGQPGLGRHNVPAGYVAGSTPQVIVTAGSSAVSARSHTPMVAVAAGAPALRLASPQLAEPVGWEPGSAARTSFSAPVAELMGRQSVEITWRWEAETDAGWAAVPGELTTRHEVYGLLDQPVLVDRSDIGSPAVPWIGVLADVDSAVTGLPPDPFAVMDALRSHVHWDEHINYNPSDGAYSDYEGSYIYWDYIWFTMSGWLDRADGIDLYCHSVACLLSSLAGTVGVDAPYQTFTGYNGSTFRTNYTQAAGSTSWLQWTFNSHGVTGVWEGDQLYIWDAAVDLDGDAQPWSLPATGVEPLGFTVEDYFDNVSEDTLEIQNTGYCFLL